ncbi:MAG: hypothetical protein V4574_02230 [Pseudomonadota bacterium]
MRPASIVQFERLYLAAMALGILVTILTWDAAVTALHANPQLTAVGPAVLACIIVAIQAAVLALWYFAARRRSVVAKWIISIWFVYSTVTMALALFRFGVRLDLVTVLSWASYLLRAWSVSYLFRPDAEAWFANKQQ